MIEVHKHTGERTKYSVLISGRRPHKTSVKTQNSTQRKSVPLYLPLTIKLPRSVTSEGIIRVIIKKSQEFIGEVHRTGPKYQRKWPFLSYLKRIRQNGSCLGVKDRKLTSFRKFPKQKTHLQINNTLWIYIIFKLIYIHLRSFWIISYSCWLNFGYKVSE